MPAPRFIVLPLDARPVCYDQVWDLARIGGIEVVMPPKEMLGYLKQPAPFELLGRWWQSTLNQIPQAPVILSLDTMAFGGLIAGRVNNESLETLTERSKTFLTALGPGHRPRYGFTSVLRIPGYDNAEEEPDYWQHYGRMLYQFSVETHQQGSMPEHLFNKIPAAVIQDFLSRREKNFNLNQAFLRFLASEQLDFLAFCQDDTGPHGLNVKEADWFRKAIQDQKLQGKAHVQTGADEVALMMLARALWAAEDKPLKIYPVYFPEHGKKVMAKFDGMPVGNVVQRHIQTLGGLMCLNPQDADLLFFINAPSDKMGDHCSQEMVVRERFQVRELQTALEKWLPQKNVALADVVYANGAEPLTIETLLEAKVPLDKLCSYAGWNTPGNTIGTALAMAAVVTWAQRYKRLNDTARRQMLFKRLLDDWYYQADVRIRLRRRGPALPSDEELTMEMSDGAALLKTLLQLNGADPTFYFPCKRLFEIGIHL